MKKKKAIIISSVLATTAVITIPTTIAVTITQNTAKTINTEKYSFDSNTFNTKKDLYNYAKNTAKQYDLKTNTPIGWSANDKTNIISFNTPKEVMDFLNNKITTQTFNSYKQDFKLNPDNSLITSELKSMDFNNNIQTADVYRGRNNTVYQTEKEAKDSYYETHEVYYYDNLFFRTKEELALYLEKNIKKWQSNQQVSSFVLQNLNNEQSLPISTKNIQNELSDTKSQTYSYVQDFVESNSQKYFEIESLNKKRYFNESNIDQITNIFDPNYVQVNSNQGKGNYIVDLSVDDEADLLGPYYVKSSSDIKMMSDTSKWRKIEGNDGQFVDNQLQKEKLTQFFNIVVIQADNEGQDENKSDKLFFNIEKLQPEIDAYFNTLRNDKPDIYYDLQDIVSTMKKGKKYSEFLKLPILFVHTMDELINTRSKQIYIDQTRKVYTDIVNHYDEVLKMAVPNYMLHGKYDQFSFANLFQFDNKTLDLNFDLDTLISKIFDEYPRLTKVMDFYSNSLILLSRLPFLESNMFDPGIYKSLFNFEIQNDEYDSFKMIWDALTAKEYEQLKEIDKQIYLTNKNERAIPENFDDIMPTILTNNMVQNYSLNNMIEKSIEYSIKGEKSGFNDDQIALLGVVDFNNNLSKENKSFFRQIINYNGFISVPTIATLKLIGNISKTPLSILFKGVKDYKSLLDFGIKALKEFAFKDFEKFDDITKFIFRTPLLNSLSFAPVFIPKKIIPIMPIKQISKSLFVASKFVAENKEKVRNIIGTYKDYMDSSITLAEDVLDMVDEATKGLSKILKAASCCLGFIGVALDLLMNIYKCDYYSYIFESEDVRYVWNGGKEESFLFGLIPGNKVGIESMKLLPPKQIVRANYVNGYYYNGIIYNSVDQVKVRQLNDILMGSYESDKFKRVYSMFDLIKNPTNNKDLFADSIDGLVTSFIESLKNVNFNDFNNIQGSIKEFISSSKYSFGAGIEYDNRYTTQQNIDNVINRIKPTLIAQIPQLYSATEKDPFTPIYSEGDIDNSIKPYKLPYKSWTANGGYEFNDDTNFVIFDPNINNKEYTTQEVKAQLDNLFYNAFSVSKKTINKSFIGLNNKFSKISSNIIINQIFVAKNDFNEEKIFLDRNDALLWLMKEYSVKTYYKKEHYTTFVYKNQKFNNEAEFINWVNLNTKEVK